MKILSREYLGFSTEMVAIEHKDAKYCVLLHHNSRERDEVLRPDCRTVRHNSKLAKSLVEFAARV